MFYSHLGHQRLADNLKSMYINHPANESSFDEGSIGLQKADELGILGGDPTDEDFEKGRPAMPIGAHATWNGVDYLKTASGWKPSGKHRGHVKANHDHIHKNEEKDKDHLAMVHDAGKMSEEEWTKKHGSKLHAKYKEVHDYIHREKKKKEAAKEETGAEKLAKLSDAEVKKLKEQSNAGFTHTAYTDADITEEMKKRNILLDVKKPEEKKEEPKVEEKKEDPKTSDNSQAFVANEYFLTQRPPSIGTHPVEGFKSLEETDYNGRKAWKLKYDRPLTDKEVNSFELKHILNAGELKGKTVNSRMGIDFKVTAVEEGKITLTTEIRGKEKQEILSSNKFKEYLDEGRFSIGKSEPAKEAPKAEEKKDTKDPNAPIGTISPDGKYRKTANGWEYIKEEKTSAAEEKKENVSGKVTSAIEDVKSGKLNSDDAAIKLDEAGIEVTDEIYDQLRDAEKQSQKQKSGLQVGDTVTVKGKNGNKDFQANYRGESKDGKLIVSYDGGKQMSVDKTDIVDTKSTTEEKKPTEDPASKSDTYHIKGDKGHVEVHVHHDAKEGHFGVDISNHTDKGVQKKDRVHIPNEKKEAFLADLAKRGGEKVGDKKEEVKPEENKLFNDNGATEEGKKAFKEALNKFKPDSNQGMNRLRSEVFGDDNFMNLKLAGSLKGVMDEYWKNKDNEKQAKPEEKDPEADYKYKTESGIDWDLRNDPNHEKHRDNFKKLTLKDHENLSALHGKMESKVSGADLKGTHSGMREMHKKLAKEAPAKMEERSASKEETKTNPEGKIVLDNEADQRKALHEYLQSGMSAKDFTSKYSFTTGANEHFTKNGKLDASAFDYLNDGQEIKVAEKPVAVKKVKEATEALKDIVSSDDLRPAMTGIYYNKGLAIATDAHKLVITKADSEQDGKIINPKTGKEIDARYPDVRVVIPDHGQAIEGVDLNELMGKLNGIVNANKLFKDPEAGGLRARLNVDNIDIHVHPELALDTLKALAKQGVSKVNISTGSKEGSPIVVTEGSNKHMALIMPLYNAGGSPSKTILEGTQNTYNSQFLSEVVRGKDFRTGKAAENAEVELKAFKEFLKTKGTTYERYQTMSGMPKIRLENQFKQERA